MKKQGTQKNIFFTQKQIELGEKIATSLGMTFNEWIKYLVTKQIEPLAEVDNKKLIEKERTNFVPFPEVKNFGDLGRRDFDEDEDNDLPY